MYSGYPCDVHPSNAFFYVEDEPPIDGDWDDRPDEEDEDEDEL